MEQTVSMYAKVFDEKNPNYTGDRDKDLNFLMSVQRIWSDTLRARERDGYMTHRVFLGEVYKSLGFESDGKADHVVGWLYSEKNPIGDNYIDFCIDYEYYLAHPEEPIVVDFNVDGTIFNMYVSDYGINEGLILEL